MINFNLPKGPNYKMLKTAYFKPIYDDKFRMTNRDCILCTIKNCDTGETHLRIFPEPEIDFYVTKTFSENAYPKIFLEKDKLIKHTCLYRDRDKELLRALNLYQRGMELKRTDYMAYREFLEQHVRNSPYLYCADTNIEDYYKTEFEIRYGNPEIIPLKKSYFDIEVDVMEYDSTEADPRTPISAISYYIPETNIFHELLLVYEDNEGQKYVRSNTIDFIQKYLMNAEIKDPDLSFNIQFFENESDLIRYFFNIFHEEKCDFLTAWNSPFDVKYTLGRAVLLGMSIPDLICSPEIPNEFKRVIYNEDPDRNRKSDKYFHRLWDWIDMANYTMIVDQMSLYSNLRKRYQFQSYSLYSITKADLGITKVNLPEYGVTIRNAHVKNYPIFVQYSIMDTYLLHLLEERNNDLGSYISLCKNTRISKGVNISIVIKNILYKDFLLNGKIIGNNITYPIWNNIPGAIVASPDNINIKNIEVFGEKSTLIFDNIIDFDAKAEYPTIMRSWNICKNTVKRRFTTLVSSDNPENIIMTGEDYFKALETLDTSLFDICSNVFDLPSIESLIEDIEEEILS